MAPILSAAAAAVSLLFFSAVPGYVEGASLQCDPCIDRANTTILSFVATRSTRNRGSLPSAPHSAWKQLERAQAAAAGTFGVVLETFSDIVEEEDWGRALKVEIERARSRNIGTLITTTGVEADFAKEDLLQSQQNAGLSVFSLTHDSASFKAGKYGARAHFGIDDEEGWSGFGEAIEELVPGRNLTKCIFVKLNEESSYSWMAGMNAIENRRLGAIRTHCQQRGLLGVNDEFVLHRRRDRGDIDTNQLMIEQLRETLDGYVSAGERVLVFSAFDPEQKVYSLLEDFKRQQQQQQLSSLSANDTRASIQQKQQGIVTFAVFELTARSEAGLLDSTVDLVVHDSMFLQELEVFTSEDSHLGGQGWYSVIAAGIHATTRQLALTGRIYETGPFYYTPQDVKKATWADWFEGQLEGSPVCRCPRSVTHNESDVPSSMCQEAYGACPHSGGMCVHRCYDIRELRVQGMSPQDRSFWATVWGGFVAAFRDLRAAVDAVSLRYIGLLDRQFFNGTKLLVDSAGTDPIMIFPTLDSIPILREYAAEGPTITINQDYGLSGMLNVSSFLGYVGQVDYEIAYEAGAFFADVMKRKHILTVEVSEDDYARARGAGARKAFQDRGLKGTRTTMWWGGNDECRDTIEREMTAQPDIDAVLTIWPLEFGTVEGVAKVGRSPADTSMGVFDSTPTAIEMVSSGELHLVVDQQGWLQGYLPLMMHAAYAASGEHLRNLEMSTGRLVTQKDISPDFLNAMMCEGLLWGEKTSGLASLPLSSLQHARSFPTCAPRVGCPPGFGGLTCQECSGGFFSSFNKTHQECEPCPEGVVCDSKIAASPVGTAMYALASERWPEDALQGQINTWTVCPAGFFCPRGSSQASPCPLGFFSEDEGQASSDVCSPCPPGHFGGVVGLSVCSTCPPGSYASESGLSECTLCPVGHYQDNTGSLECKKCPFDHSTTVLLGVSSESECVCSRGYVLEGSSFESPWTSRTQEHVCVKCAAGWQCDAVFYEGTSGALVASSFYASEYNPSVAAFSCPGGSVACPGGRVDTCAYGSSSVNCAKCASGFFLSHDKACLPCDDDDIVPAIIILVVCIAVLCVVLYLLSLPYHVDSNQSREVFLRVLSFSSVVSLELEFLQLFWIFGKITTGWPQTVRDILAAPNVFFSLSFLRPGCYLGDDRATAPLMVLIPLGIPFILAAEYLLGRMLLPATSLRRPSLMLSVNLLWSIFEAFFIIIFNNTLNTVFATDDHGNGQSTVKQFPFIVMGSSEWHDIIPWGLVGVLLWCVGYLSLYTYAMLHKKKWPAKSLKHDCCLFVFKRFRRGKSYWGFLMILRRMLICAALALFSISTHQIMFLLCILLIALLAQAQFSPMLSTAAHSMDMVFLALACALLSAALMAEAEQSDVRFAESTYGQEVLSWVTAFTYSCYAVALVVSLMMVRRLYFVGDTARAEDGERTWTAVNLLISSVDRVLDSDSALKAYRRHLEFLSATDRKYLEIALKLENEALSDLLHLVAGPDEEDKDEKVEEDHYRRNSRIYPNGSPSVAGRKSLFSERSSKANPRKSSLVPPSPSLNPPQVNVEGAAVDEVFLLPGVVPT